MKKFSILLAALVFGIMNSAAYAEVGYVNYATIIQNYPLAKKAFGELEKKQKSIKEYVMQKEIEYLKAGNSNQKALKEQTLKDLQAKEAEFNKLKQQKETEISGEIKKAIDAVREEKKLEMVLDSKFVHSGGTDVTSDVINKLK